MADFGLLPVLASIALLGASTDSNPGGLLRPADSQLRLILTAEESQGEGSVRTVDSGNKWLKYGLIGAGACAAAGGTIGYFATTETCGYDIVVGPGCETDRRTVEGALIGAGIGAICGVLMGLREDRLSQH